LIKPKKSLGQNFLIDNNIIKKIINITKIYNKNIIEVGPGLGILTDEIIKHKPKKLIIIEKDDEIYELLKKKYQNNKISIINDDIMNFNFNKLSNFNIISNLPYNISSKFLLKILKLNSNINEIICMIQSELADKFDFRKDKMNKYKFLNQYCSKYEKKFDVSPKVFYPRPNVKSKVVKFTLKKQKINHLKLENFIKLFFVNKRKIIKSNKKFSKIIETEKLNYRYEDLKFKEILEIYERF